MKRTLALILVLALLPLFPIARAAEPETLEDIIAAQYDAYAASISQDKMDEKAVDQLLEPALYSKGETLHFDESDALTATLYGTDLFRTWFVKAASYAVRNMASLHYSQAMLGGTTQWYDYAQHFDIIEYLYDETTSYKDDLAYKTVLKEAEQQVVSNKCSNALVLTVGRSNVRLRLNRTAVDADSITYRADIFWNDSFSFEGEYSMAADKGYNTAFSTLLSVLGPLLGLKSFHWDSTSGFSITVPNLCTHSGGGSFYWENVDQDLTSIPGEEHQDNPLTKRTRKPSANSTPSYYYTVEKPIELLNHNPWSIEFYCSTNSLFYVGPVSGYTDTWLMQLKKNSTDVNAIFVEMYKETSASSGNTSTRSKYHYYGLDYVEQGVGRWGKKVFRIENRISDDGSNMPWLLVDGKEIGPLNFYKIYYSSSKKFEPIGTENSWIDNKIFTIRYIYNYSSAFTTNPLYWLRIDTAGDVITTREVSATCKQGAGVETTCLLCGAVWVEPTGEPLAHTSQTIPGTPATCHSTGMSDGSVCSVCGEILQAQEILPMLSHKESPVKGFAPTCTQTGLSDGTVCSVCQEVLTVQVSIPALGHNPEKQPGVAADCVKEGLTEGSYCTVCNDVLTAQTVLPALGHTFDTGSCTRCGAADPNWWMPGDADGNGTLNYQDALLVLRCSVGLESLPPFAALACDMDGNGTLTYNDALVILRRSIGLA